MAGFTFGGVLEQEIQAFLDTTKQDLENQIRMVKETANKTLVDMESTKKSYDTAAATKLTNMDSTLNDKLASMQATVTQQTAGLVNRVSSLETEKEQHKTKLSNLTGKLNELETLKTEIKTQTDALKVKVEELVEKELSGIQAKINAHAALFDGISRAASGQKNS